MSDAYHRIVADVASIARSCGRDPSTLTVLAVSKGYPLTAITEIYDAGCREFGESRVQEAEDKMSQAPKDIQWHLIGSLQRKKVPKVVGKFALIHSVDTLELAQALSKASFERAVTTAILLEVNTSGEASKHGLTPVQWNTHIHEVLVLPGLNVNGFMTMAPLTDDTNIVRDCFQKLRLLKESIEADTGHRFPHLSMGMSHDYAIAIQEGATILRIGTALFGKKSGVRIQKSE